MTIALDTSVYIHIIALAVNRFHAVYFPFNYQQIWDKKYVEFFNKILEKVVKSGKIEVHS